MPKHRATYVLLHYLSFIKLLVIERKPCKLSTPKAVNKQTICNVLNEHIFLAKHPDKLKFA